MNIDVPDDQYGSPLSEISLDDLLEEEDPQEGSPSSQSKRVG